MPLTRRSAEGTVRRMGRVAVLGTGMAGFGAWHRLRDEPHDVVLYDKNPYAGGHTYSWSFPPGFTFDEGPHVSFTKDERIMELLAEAVDGEFEQVQYHLDNYWRGHWITHPVQTNMFGLPPDLIEEVIVDFVEETRKPETPIRNYEDWLVSAYGRRFAEEFPDGVHAEVPHDLVGEHDDRLDRPAHVPAEPRGGAAWRTRSRGAECALHHRLPLPDPRRLRGVPRALGGGGSDRARARGRRHRPDLRDADVP